MKDSLKTLTWAGILLILLAGLIHLVDAPDAFQEMKYKGVLFVASGLSSLIASIGIARGAKIWGWDLGLLVAISAIIGYVLSRTIGLPGIPAEPDAWLEPLGVASLMIESLFVLVFALVARRSGASE